MNRRFVLRVLPLGGAAATVPMWLTRALAGSAFAAVFDDALRRATLHGKPLLVLLEEAGHPEWSERGGIFGQLLTYGPDELFEDLALCEVVCTDPDAIGDRIERAGDTPIMVLIETDSID